jgi:hypothetical protein
MGGPDEELDLYLFLWYKDKWVVLGEELDLHLFPGRTLSLSRGLLRSFSRS